MIRKINFSKPSECLNIWYWIYHDWNFFNKDRYREIGWRFLGLEFIKYLTVKKWERSF